MAEDELIERLRNFSADHLSHVPHAGAIGMRPVNAARGKCTLMVPYQDKLVGNPATGVVHGGVITSLLDNASGAATQFALDEPTPIATLDLRIDYLKPATPGEDIFGDAHCYKVTRTIAFVRGVAYHTSPEDPIATSVATFMLSANRGPVPTTASVAAAVAEGKGGK